MSKRQKFCGECGAALGSEVRFCGECGTAVKQKHDKADEQQRPRQQTTQQSCSDGKSAGLKIIPLLLWAGSWGGGLMLGCGVAYLLGAYWLFYYFFSGSVWIWLSTGLLAGASLQWFSITDQKPTGKMAGTLILSWGLIFFVLPWMHFDTILVMLPVGITIGAGLAWLITGPIAGQDSWEIPRPARMNLIGSWACCGIGAGIPYWHVYLPYRTLIFAFLFFALCIFLFLQREK